jgi:predicted DNA binding CopG/RHH family protein
MTDKEREAHNRKCLAYQKKLGQFSIKLQKDDLAKYKQAAEKAGMPFRAWVLNAMDKAMGGIENA